MPSWPTPTALRWSTSPTHRRHALCQGRACRYPTRGPAVALSKGLDRDRAVDETGNQVAVFGRRGARPLSYEEQRRLFVHAGAVYTVPVLHDDDDAARRFGPPRWPR